MNEKDRNFIKRINNSNFNEEIEHFKNDLKNATFLSLDTEFSGIGFSNIRQNDISERYVAMLKVLRNRSLYELGVAIYTQLDEDDSSDKNEYSTSSRKRKLNLTRRYEIKIYNFVLLNSFDHTISPHSMTFLAQHGFDFNELFLHGIPFNVKKHDEAPPTSPYKIIIDSLSKCNVPVIVHNGILDLLFIFQTFIAELPDQLTDFISILLKYFPKVFDTKYISEYCDNPETRSFLPYLFSKYERHNFQRIQNEKSHISCEIKGYSIPFINITHSLYKPWENNVKLCSDFSNHGYCKLGMQCKNSHDITLILDQEEHKRNKVRERKRIKLQQKELQQEEEKTKDDIGVTIDNNENQKDKDSDSEIEESEEISNNNNNSNVINQVAKFGNYNIHSAGFDAAMTGFVFCYFHMTVPDLANLDQSKFLNRIYLSGKNTSLYLQATKYPTTNTSTTTPSSFNSLITSTYHKKKWNIK
ncbi:hypothetical protein DLAC_01866 [Tieghemostelium lacteum]|uniref:C3H1-type domain-containing protein n=1 Tax=Tieghemostelium lacteum TaxID=361077 RepID=A0A152A6K6_TIELA|nr:hypothetical protein DLAC_01866 [Tieghemostelium lacteum]|eukprot:KYR01849.1 hypothetical protein DLAC_01866 [Tieghemostelium lacteum]